MKATKIILLTWVLLLALLPVYAADTVVRVTAEARGLAEISPAQLPRTGTFWLVQPSGNSLAPLPCPPTDLSLPVFQIANGQFLVDASHGTPLAALEKQAHAVVQLIEQIQAHALVQAFAFAMGLAAPGAPGDGSGEGGYELGPPDNASLIDTNLVWLEINGVSNSLAYLNLHKATAPVYAIWTTTNLLTAWRVERDLWPTNTVGMPFTLPTLGRTNLFVRAQDWTGVDGNSNSIPDWWEWKYLTNLSGTNVVRALSTAYADVSNAVAQAAPGKTVFVPAGTNAWNKTLTISGISLIGLGTNVTRLLDNEPGGNGFNPLILMSVVTNAFTRVSGLTLADSTNSFQNFRGKIKVNGESAIFWRVDHCQFIELYGHNLYVECSGGLIDHNTFVLRGNAMIGSAKLPSDYGDASWHDGPSYGSISNLVVENNWFTNIVPGSSSSAVFDGYFGSRSIFRYNTVLNTFYNNQGFPYALHFRSGTGAVFSNTVTGYGGLAAIDNYRSTDPFDPWG
jgi:hypothetical protein